MRIKGKALDREIFVASNLTLEFCTVLALWKRFHISELYTSTS